MPSRRLRRPPPPGSDLARRSSPPRRATLRPLAVAVLTTAVAAQLACSGAPGPRTPAPAPAAFPGLAAAERPYLLDPLEGYPLVAGGDREARLAAAYAGLRRSLDRAAARAVAAELLAVEPGFHPAVVLAAQADFIDGEHRRVVEALAPVTAELPGYSAAELLLGRAAEVGGEPLVAFAAYWRAAEASPLADERVSELRPRAVEIVANRIADALARGRLDAAAAALADLERWAPGEATTVEAAGAVARARGDGEAELAAVAQLARLRPDDRAVAERWGELELEVGDPGRGLALFERLAERYPGDPEIAARVGYAKFRWRVAQLPARVQRAAQSADVSRGDFAVLLYWLVPSVRYGRPVAARIAADILDDPRREEIARVINLGLMDVNVDLHRFAPDSPLARGDAMLSLLRLIAAPGERAGGDAGDGGGASCAAEIAGVRRPSSELVCAAAARCRLIAAAGDCLPTAPVTGREALDVIRRGLDLAR